MHWFIYCNFHVFENRLWSVAAVNKSHNKRGIGMPKSQEKDVGILQFLILSYLVNFQSIKLMFWVLMFIGAKHPFSAFSIENKLKPRRNLLFKILYFVLQVFYTDISLYIFYQFIILLFYQFIILLAYDMKDVGDSVFSIFFNNFRYFSM